jgi:DNA-binding CsgD family transcriptional regulator
MASNGTLIGRGTELETIERVVDGAREGRSGVLVLRGVAGVGKTALLDRCVADADGMRVLRAEGVESETHLPFAGLHQLLRPLTGLLGRLPAVERGALAAAFGLAPGDAAARFLAAAGALDLIAEAAEERPVLCVVDDLHWLDPASTDALLFVARRLDAEPVALLLALRDPGPQPPGLSRLPALELGGLQRDDARALLDRSAAIPAADRDRVLDTAAGIPLALLELPRGPLGAGPATDGAMGTVERAFGERVAALPDTTRRAVLLAAADDDPRAATALLALDGAALGVADLAAAEADGLLWLDSGGLAFRHPLVRSAAYGVATFAERRDAHAALAAALTGPDAADRRAWHRAAALTSPDDDVAAELESSAERALARGGHAAAAAALERAARLTSADGARARRLVAAAQAARLAGDVDHAVGLAQEGGALAADEATAAEAAGVRGAIQAHRGRPEDAEEDLTRAARALARADPRRALRTALVAAEAAALAGDHARAEELARFSASLPAGEGDLARAHTAWAGGIADLFGGRVAEARERFAETATSAERSGDAQAMTWAAIGVFYGGDLAGARRAFLRALAAARARGAIGVVAFGLPCVANMWMLEGRFTLGRADAEEGLALAGESGEDGGAAYCRALLAWHAAVRGWEDDCAALAAETLAWSGPDTPRPATECAHHALALLDLALGRHDAAFDRLSAVVDDPRGHPVRRLYLVGDLVDAAASRGRPDDARGALAALAAWTRATGSAWGAATLAGAEVHLAPDADRAESAFAEAEAAHAAIDLPFDRARLELRLGEQLRRARRRVDARRHLRSAVDAFARAGATPWEQRAANELRATGETARRREPSTLDELTPQEAQIARLVAEGATNRDIAARLFLSPRTVEYHLRKVFRKLGLSSRTQLAALDW